MTDQNLELMEYTQHYYERYQYNKINKQIEEGESYLFNISSSDCIDAKKL